MKVAGIALVGATILAATAAHADVVDATLSATYFQVADGTDSDFNGGPDPTVADGSTLGANGLPQASGVHDLHNGQLTWWSPTFDSHVQETGTGSVSLPYSSNMYAPNSTGNNDYSYFETAVLQGNFSLASASTVGFTLGSDDDSFIYVDGVLIGQNPGIHGVTTVDFTSGTLDAGSHSIEVFYADRQNSGAYLALNLDSTSQAVVITPTNPVPEPASLALIGAGLAGLVGLRRRRAA